MRYSDELLRFSFDVPPGWELSSAPAPPTLPRVRHFRSEHGMIEICVGDKPLRDGHSSVDLGNPDARELFRRYIKEEGYAVVEIGDGRLGDDRTCIRAEMRTKDRAKEALLLAVRGGLVYMVRYRGDLDAREQRDFDGIAASFSFVPEGRLEEIVGSIQRIPEQTLRRAELVRPGSVSEVRATLGLTPADDVEWVNVKAFELGEKAAELRREKRFAEALELYGKVLECKLSDQDRAKTLANVMQAFESQGAYDAAVRAAVAAYQIIQKHRLYRTNEGAYMRGAIRGFLLRIRDEHMNDLQSDDAIGMLFYVTHPAVSFIDMVFGHARVALWWAAGLVSFVIAVVALTR